MCGSMADIQSAAAEIRRGKKKNKPQHENIMVCPIPQGDHNNIDDDDDDEEEDDKMK